MRILLLAIATITLMSCQDLDIVKYEYQTSTMMGRTVLSVTQDSVVVTFSGRGEPTYYGRAVKPSEWKAVNASMKKVDLTEVPFLKAPSNARATDRVAYAKFTFIGEKTSTTSSDFDANKPHDMLMPLMKEIQKIQKANKP
jgi:hypothetical protein